jgi:hypothetical protein
MVASVAPSGAFRGSVIAGIASLAVTGAIAIPAVTSSDSGRSSRADAVSTQVAEPAPTTPPAPTTLVGSATDPAAPASVFESASEQVTSGVVQVAAWWTEWLVEPDETDADTGAPSSDAPADPGAPMPDFCATSPSLRAASASRRVVSTLDLPAGAVSALGDNVYTFGADGILAVEGGGSLHADATACLAPDGSYGALVVTLTDGSTTVSLAGTSRFGDRGVWVFRGTAKSDVGSLPWSMRPDFLARLVLAGEGEEQTATLSLAFYDDEGSTTPQGAPDPIVVPPTTEPPTTTTPPTTTPPTTTAPTTPPPADESTEGSGPPAAP